MQQGQWMCSTRMTSEVLLVLTNCPDADSADKIAQAAINRRLAGCVSRLPPVASIYRWQGAVETAEEHPLLIKTTRARYAELERMLSEMHPYTTPEIIALPVDVGYRPYLRWVAEETQSPLSE